MVSFSYLSRQGDHHPIDFTGVTEISIEKSPPAKPGDEDLIDLAQGGDSNAFEDLVERYKQKAYRIAFDFTRDREEAKDLSQEAFLRAYTHLKGFDRRAGFYTWFYRILVNLCLDYRRRKARVSWKPFDESTDRSDARSDLTSSPEQAALAGEVSRKVDAALDALPQKQRTAFILKNHQGLSIHEIAEVMQIAEGTAKVHLHRAVMALRQRLAELA